jgi:hypothetical protein
MTRYEQYHNLHLMTSEGTVGGAPTCKLYYSKDCYSALVRHGQHNFGLTLVSMLVNIQILVYKNGFT